LLKGTILLFRIHLFIIIYVYKLWKIHQIVFFQFGHAFKTTVLEKDSCGSNNVRGKETITLLKGPKLEIFGSEVFKQIRPVWLCDLGTKPKTSKF
jgi:hypothetical protein